MLDQAVARPDLRAAPLPERLSRRITAPLAVGVIGVALVAFTAFVADTYREVKRELTDVVMARRIAVAQLAAATSSERLDRMVELTVSLATRVRFAELVSAGRWQAAMQILRDVPAQFRFIDRLVLYDAKGTLMADVPELPDVRSKNFAYRDWYRGVARGWKPYVSEVYRRAAAPQRHVFAVAVPVADRGAGPAGILQLQVDLASFFDWAQAIDLGIGGSVYVVDAKGTVAFHSATPVQDRLTDLSAAPAVAKLLQGKSGVDVTTGGEGTEQLSAFVPGRHGWGVVVEQPAAEAFAARENQLRRLLVGYGLMLVFFAAVAGLAMHLLRQRRRMEALNAELEDLYNLAPCGYHSVDADGLIVRMNDTWLAWLGYAREEVVGKKRHPDLMTPESAERFRSEAFPLFKKQGWLKEVEFEYVRKDGSTFPGSLQTSTIYDANGRYLMSRTTVFDISARKHAEEKVRALNKELESFSYSVSHDLRAPLRAVDGYSRMLEEDYGARLDDEARRLLGVVRSSTRQMAQLIDDLLAFSRLGRQEPNKGPVDMQQLAREVVAEALPQRGAASVEVAPLPAAQADRALLKQVWANLVGNALKYSGRRERPRVEIGARAEPAENVYWVRDNGAGFDMRYAAKLFGVFQRLHRADEFPGTGVGLAIVQRVIARHGGRVWAEGRPDEGACFYFTLPKES